MDESGVDMVFDLTAALTADLTSAHHAVALGDYDDDFEQTLSLLSSTKDFTKDFMYYELKSRAPDTGRYVIERQRTARTDGGEGGEGSAGRDGRDDDISES